MRINTFGSHDYSQLIQYGSNNQSIWRPYDPYVPYRRRRYVEKQSVDPEADHLILVCVGGGHAPDIIVVCEHDNVLPSSTNPTRPYAKNTLDEHLDVSLPSFYLSRKR